MLAHWVIVILPAPETTTAMKTFGFIIQHCKNMKDSYVGV